MALNFFNDLYQAPMAVAVLSDSLSALQAVKNNSKSSREDVVKEIVVVCHQLITRGTDIVLQWVPMTTDNSHPSVCDVSCVCRRDGLSLSDSVAAQLRTVVGWVMNMSAVIICTWHLITVVK